MLTIHARHVALGMAASIFILMAANAAVHILVASGFQLTGPARFFNLDEEGNLPSWYSSLTLTASALLLLIIGLNERATQRQWLGLSALFLFLSMDETAGFHEMFIGPLQRTFGFTGPFFFAWIIPAAVALLILAAIYARWFFWLPPRTRRLMLFAGGTFLAGAMGMEMIGGALASQGQRQSWQYRTEVAIEEFCEMMGILLWVYALIEYARHKGHTLSLTFERSETNAAASSHNLSRAS